MDSSIVAIIMSGVTSVAAIVAPVITAKINQRGNRILRSMELLYEARRESYSAYLHALTEITMMHCTETVRRIQECCKDAALLASDETQFQLVQCTSGALKLREISADQKGKTLAHLSTPLVRSTQSDLRQYQNAVKRDRDKHSRAHTGAENLHPRNVCAAARPTDNKGQK